MYLIIQEVPGGLRVDHSPLLGHCLLQNLERLGHHSGATTLVLVILSHVGHVTSSGSELLIVHVC